MNHEFHTGSDSQLNGRVDAALRAIGAAAPPAGFEGRILTRLAAERVQNTASFQGLRVTRFPRFAGPAVCVLSSCLVAVVIVAGSVSHSRHSVPSPSMAAPVLHLPASGVGAASAAQEAPPASAPIPAGKSARGHSRRSAQGRARIAPHARKAPGVVVPSSPAPPQN